MNILTQSVIDVVSQTIRGPNRNLWEVAKFCAPIDPVLKTPSEVYWYLRNPEHHCVVFVYLIHACEADFNAPLARDFDIEIAPLDGFVLSVTDDGEDAYSDDPNWDGGTTIMISTRGQHAAMEQPYGEYITWEYTGFPPFLLTDHQAENMHRIAVKDYDRALDLMLKHNMVRDPDDDDLSPNSPFRALPVLTK